MPEGPEYRVIAKEIPPLGELVHVETSRHSRDFMTSREQQSLRAGIFFEPPQAYGKSLWFPLFNPEKNEEGVLVSQLGMSGRWILSATAKPSRHDHLSLHFKNQIVLRYHDPRRFGSMAVDWGKNWREIQAEWKLEKKWGMDPLESGVTAKAIARHLQAVFADSCRSIKTALLDASVLLGSGNYLASEILWAARIHPLTPVGRLGPKEMEALAKTSQAIMRKAVYYSGNSIENGVYLRPSGNAGRFWEHLAAYGKAGNPCKRCGTPITRIVVSKRSTFYCGQCQKIKGVHGD